MHKLGNKCFYVKPIYCIVFSSKLTILFNLHFNIPSTTIFIDNKGPTVVLLSRLLYSLMLEQQQKEFEFGFSLHSKITTNISPYLVHIQPFI